MTVIDPCAAPVYGRARVGRVALAVLALVGFAACSADNGGQEGTAEEGGATSSDSGVRAAPTVRVATLNVLHGHPAAVPECADDDQCGASDRMQILFGHIEDSDCPEIVTLQEVDERLEDLIAAGLGDVCVGGYSLHLLADPAVSLGIDREAVLTSLPVTSESLLDLPSVPWSAHHVVVESELGLIDVVTTHLASGVNNPMCGSTDCTPPCGAVDDARTCGARMILDHLERVGGDGLWVVTGDLNAEPSEPAQRMFLDAGFLDVVEEAGLPECTTTSAEMCTVGRSESDLNDPEAGTDERIDYILVQATDTCPLGFSTPDVDGWADDAVEAVGSSGVVWASDHDGVIATLRCD